jgi:hypothetical protein
MYSVMSIGPWPSRCRRGTRPARAPAPSCRLRRSHEEEGPDGPLRIAETRAGAPHRVGHGDERVILADHALAQAVLDAQELLDLAFQHPGDGDARPLGDDLRHVFGVHLLLEHPLAARLRKALLLLLELRLQLGQRSVAELGRLVEVALARGLLQLEADLVDALLDLLDLLDLRLLALPLRLQGRGLLAEVRQLLLDLGQPLPRGLVLLLGEGLALDLELDDAALDLVDLLGHGIDLDAQLAARLVDEVDGLVGEEPVRDVAVGEGGRGHDRGVLDAHAVVHFVALLQPAQDRDRLLDRRLPDVDGLEAALEGGVLLDVLLVFAQGGGAHAAQLAAGQHRLEHVGGVHRPLGRARADHGVQLVDEQDDLALRLRDLLEDGLEAVLELAAVFRSRDEGAEVEGDQLLVLERLRHVAGDDALGQPLHDCGLADAGLADEDGLFLVRRESTCITRRTSSSRPMTGSSLPLRATSVRSRPYFSSAW